jgi:hypothetical protein
MDDQRTALLAQGKEVLDHMKEPTLDALMKGMRLMRKRQNECMHLYSSLSILHQRLLKE